jgi:hypothetical protein
VMTRKHYGMDIPIAVPVGLWWWLESLGYRRSEYHQHSISKDLHSESVKKSFILTQDLKAIKLLEWSAVGSPMH